MVRPCNFHILVYFLTIQKQVEKRTEILLAVFFQYLKKREVKSVVPILCDIVPKLTQILICRIRNWKSNFSYTKSGVWALSIF